MSSMSIKTIHTVDGINVVDLTKPEMINIIANAEADLEDLGRVKASSKAIEAEKARIQAFIDGVVKLLDNKKS